MNHPAIGYPPFKWKPHWADAKALPHPASSLQPSKWKVSPLGADTSGDGGGNCLLVSTPLKNIRQLGWFPVCGKIPNMLQTTNQLWFRIPKMGWCLEMVVTSTNMGFNHKKSLIMEKVSQSNCPVDHGERITPNNHQWRLLESDTRRNSLLRTGVIPNISFEQPTAVMDTNRRSSCGKRPKGGM